MTKNHLNFSFQSASLKSSAMQLVFASPATAKTQSTSLNLYGSCSTLHSIKTNKKHSLQINCSLVWNCVMCSLVKSLIFCLSMVMTRMVLFVYHKYKFIGESQPRTASVYFRCCCFPITQVGSFPHQSCKWIECLIWSESFFNDILWHKYYSNELEKSNAGRIQCAKNVPWEPTIVQLIFELGVYFGGH